MSTVTPPRNGIPIGRVTIGGRVFDVEVHGEYLRFFASMLNRVGGVTGSTTTEIEVAETVDQSGFEAFALSLVTASQQGSATESAMRAEIDALRNRIDAMEARPSDPITVLAAPTASVGLTAIPGVATTVMPSDAAPAIDQAIVPTWTGKQTFTANAANTGSISIETVSPQHDFVETDAAADEKITVLRVNGKTVTLRALNDARSASSNAISFLRGTGAAWATITYGNATDRPNHLFAGKMYPMTDAGATQTASALYAGTGAPNNANGADGDYYFRSDGGVATHIYFKAAGAWAGII